MPQVAHADAAQRGLVFVEDPFRLFRSERCYDGLAAFADFLGECTENDFFAVLILMPADDQ